MARVIAIANQKGGVGKTTTVVNLAACLWSLDQKVLVVDVDCQGNATHWLGVDPEDTLDASIQHVLVEERPIKDVIVPSLTEGKAREGLDLVPSNIRLATADQLLPTLMNPQQRLAKALRPVLAEYDYVFIDTPPSLSHCSVNALVAADLVVFVFTPDPLSFLGWDDLKETLRAVIHHFEHSILGYSLLCRFDSRQNADKDFLARLDQEFGDANLPPVRKSVSVIAAMNRRLPLVDCKPNSAPAQDYQAIAEEMFENARAEDGETRGVRVVKG